MNTKVWYLLYFEGVYHTRMIETFSNANARMLRMVHTMDGHAHGDGWMDGWMDGWIDEAWLWSWVWMGGGMAMDTPFCLFLFSFLFFAS